MQRGVWLLLVCSLSFADTVRLKSGRTHEGRILKETDAEVVIRTYKDGDVTVKRDDVKEIKKGPSKFDQYEEKAKTFGETAEDQYKLGNWCREQGLPTLAREHWEKTIALDPKHEGAHKALGHKKDGDAWLPEEEWYKKHGYVKYKDRWVKQEEYDRLRTAGAVECKMKVGVVPDADAKWFEGLKGRLKAGAEAVWNGTEGQMWISEFIVTDKSKDGEIVLENLDEHMLDKAKGVYAVTEGTRMRYGGMFDPYTFLHEWGHFKFGLPEEYVQPKCKKCAQGSGENIAPYYCDKANHTGKGDDCWTIILRRYKTWKHPNKDFGKCPEPRIVINDR